MTPSTVRDIALSLNCQHTDKPDQATATIDAALALVPGAGLWALQEVQSRVQMNHLSTRAKELGLDVVWAGGVGADGWPLLNDRNFLPIVSDPRRWKLAQTPTASPAGDARPNVEPHRFVVRAVFDHIASGQQIPVCNTQLTSGVDGVGKAPRAWRRTQHAKGVGALARALKLDPRRPAIGFGDMNTTRLAKLLAGSGLTMRTDTNGTHGRRIAGLWHWRAIDWCVTNSAPGLNVLSVRAVAAGYSDHKALVVTIDLAKKGTTVTSKPTKPKLLARQGLALTRARTDWDSPQPVGWCLKRTDALLGIPAVGDFDGDGMADAEDWWKAAVKAGTAHPEIDPAKIPPGVRVFWGGGSHDNGHAALSAHKRGYIWSVDILRPGHWDRVPTTLINEKWGLPLLGWVDDTASLS